MSRLTYGMIQSLDGYVADERGNFDWAAPDAQVHQFVNAPLSIGGPTIAADAIRAGLVDEYYFLTCPVIVGGGLRALPDDARLDLELVDERSFANGVVFTRYRAR